MKIKLCMVPEIWNTTERVFCHFAPFFALFPPMDPENQNFKKGKKCIKISSSHKCAP